MLRATKSRENVQSQQAVLPNESAQAQSRNLLSKIQRQLATALDQKKAVRA